MDRIRLRARKLRHNPTEAEKLLWRQLRFWQIGGYKFRRQQPLGKYIVDFICFEKRLVIELDGGQHAEQQMKYDSERRVAHCSRVFCFAFLERRSAEEH
jgi:very-short-patch-repair endonuclease